MELLHPRGGYCEVVGGYSNTLKVKRQESIKICQCNMYLTCLHVNCEEEFAYPN